MLVSDSRLKQWAYIQDGQRLYEVVKGVHGGEIEIEDCQSGYRQDLKMSDVESFELVREAPDPDRVPDQPLKEAASGA